MNFHPRRREEPEINLISLVDVLLGEAIRVDLPELAMEIKWLISHVSQVKKLGRNIDDQFRSACIP